MEHLGVLVRKMRFAAGLSQRAFAQRAETSQSAIARYERGTATPSWQTLQRLAAAAGQRVEIKATGRPDPHDVELAETLLGLTPLERLQALPRYARLQGLARAAR
jgi:transcriptional regulator with XRE-family HTH domain